MATFGDSMSTILFWIVICAASLFIFYKTSLAAQHDVAGEKKIEGKWVQVMYPDHYTASGIYLVYCLGLLVILFLLYLVASLLLDFTGYAEIWGIETGFQSVKDFFRM